MRRVALVDFDGVVLRNPRTSQYIHGKVTTYVSKKAGVCMPVAHAFNQELYTAYGHTYLGLKAHGFSHSLKDFNDYVYGNPEEYEHFKLNSGEWEGFVRTMKEHNVTVKLFSNADRRWLTNFIPYDKDLYSFQDYRDSVPELELLKPKRDIYDFVHYHLPKSKFVLIDDKVSSFCAKLSDPRWYHIWVTNSQHAHPAKLKDNQAMAPDLLTATNFIIES